MASEAPDRWTPRSSQVPKLATVFAALDPVVLQAVTDAMSVWNHTASRMREPITLADAIVALRVLRGGRYRDLYHTANNHLSVSGLVFTLTRRLQGVGRRPEGDPAVQEVADRLQALVEDPKFTAADAAAAMAAALEGMNRRSLPGHAKEEQ